MLMCFFGTMCDFHKTLPHATGADLLLRWMRMWIFSSEHKQEQDLRLKCASSLDGWRGDIPVFLSCHCWFDYDVVVGCPQSRYAWTLCTTCSRKKWSLQHLHFGSQVIFALQMSHFCGFVASRGDFATLNWAVGDDSSIFVPQHRRLRSLPVFCRTHRLSGMRLSYLGLIWALFLAGELDSSQISQTPRRHEVFRFDTQSLDPSACLVAWVVWGPRCQDACFEPETVWGGIVWIMSQLRYFAGWSQLVSRIPFSIQKCLWCVDSTNSISMWIWNICNICILEVGNQPIQYGFISIVFHNQDR